MGSLFYGHMARKYGLPYKGSKSKIAEKLIETMPLGKAFVDLFAGGCAMTHAAMLSGKYERFIVNDIESDITQLFVDTIAGRYKDERRWISRDEFELLKDYDPYARYCWSFGNNGRDYLYSRELEPYKKALHEMIFAETTYERRIKYKAVLKELYLLGTLNAGREKARKLDTQRADRKASLESLQSLQSLERYNP